MEAQLKSQLMQQEFNYNLQLRGIDENALSQREKTKEKKRKAKGLVNKTLSSLN